MDRKTLLQRLINDRFSGSQADFARAIKRSAPQINQWLSGHRVIGDAGARHIELTLKLPSGYFDGGYQSEAGNRTTSALQEGSEQRKEYGANVATLAVKEDPLIEQAVAIMKATDATGRAMALAAIKVALNGYQPAKANHAS